MDFSLDVSTLEGCTVVRLGGEVDVASGPRVQEQVLAIDGPLVLDLEGVTFLDSSGLGALVVISDAVDGPLRIARPSARVSKVLALTGLDQVVAVFDSVEEAVSGGH